MDHQGRFELYRYLKPITTILILAFPIIFWNKKNVKYNLYIISALVFCLIGDVFLLREDQFIYGLGSFLIAHLIFSFGFITLNGLTKRILPFFILLFIGGAYLLFLKPGLGELFIPVIIYLTVILFMVWQAIGVSLDGQKDDLKLLGVAACLFAFSDALIAFNKFIQPMEYAGIFVLSTYWLAIFFMAASTQESIKRIL